MTLRLPFHWRLRVWREKPKVVVRGSARTPSPDEVARGFLDALRADQEKRASEDNELVERIWPLIREHIAEEGAAILGWPEGRFGAATETIKQALDGAPPESDGIVSDDQPGQFPVAVHLPIEEPGQQDQPAVPTIALNDINAQIAEAHAELQALPKGPDTAEEIVALQNRLRTLYKMRDGGRR